MCVLVVLGRGQLDVLEYIHENEYVHADIKASNLMVGYKDPEKVKSTAEFILDVVFGYLVEVVSLQNFAKETI